MDHFSVLFPDGPTFMIHKGWDPRKPRQIIPIANSSTRIYSQLPRYSKPLVPENLIGSGLQRRKRQRQYQFINSQKPEEAKNPEVVKVVRSHVRKELIQDARDEEAVTKSNQVLHHSDRQFQLPISNIVEGLNFPCLLGPPTSCSKYSIQMPPHTHVLLSSYLTYASSRMFPIGSCLISNPLKSPEWFHFAIADEAMFHAVLYAAALYLGLLRGTAESKDTIYHQNKTIMILQKRLNASKQHFDDSTLGAISCLALGEAISGNVNRWQVHMRGLKQVIRSRGNISSLSSLLQAKLYRSDVTGAIDYGLSPYLDLHSSTTKPIWSILPCSTRSSTSIEMKRLLIQCEMHPALIQILTSLSLFIQTLSHARSHLNISLSPEAFSNDLYTLEHTLLSFPSTLPSQAHEPALSVALRLAALICLKSILQEFPHSVNGSRILVERLRQSLSLVWVGEEDGKLALVRWMCVVGSAVAKGEVKGWFVRKLGRMRLNWTSEEDVGFARLLDLKDVFGKKAIEDIREEISMA